MQLQQHLIRVWITISLRLSRFILSRTTRHCLLYIAIIVFIAFSLSALRMPDLSIFHLLNSVPFGEPFPP